MQTKVEKGSSLQDLPEILEAVPLCLVPERHRVVKNSERKKLSRPRYSLFMDQKEDQLTLSKSGTGSRPLKLV